METYKLHVAGLERDLPICPLNDNLSIAGFVMFGDDNPQRGGTAQACG